MWIFQHESYLSVVADRDNEKRLLVRSRIAGDIEKAIPSANVFEDPKADYRYRAFISREELKRALDKAVDNIDYDNFKESVRDQRRHDAYLKVWGAMANEYGAFGRE